MPARDLIHVNFFEIFFPATVHVKTIVPVRRDLLPSVLPFATFKVILPGAVEVESTFSANVIPSGNSPTVTVHTACLIPS